MLARPRHAERIATTCAEAIRGPLFRLALYFVGAHLLLTGYVFSPDAAILLLFLLSVAGVLAARYGGAIRLQNGAVGVALASTGLAILLAAGEIVSRMPAVNRRFGLPQEIANLQSSYDRLWERNILGFRSPHERLDRTPGTKRVLVLGDSFTWGEGVALTADTWPNRLESALSDSLSTTPVEVVNTAKRGYSTVHEAELLRRLGWQFDPDVLIVQFFVNDAQLSGPNFEHLTRDPDYRLIPSNRFRSGAVRSSALLALLEKGYGTLRRGSRPNAWLDEMYADDFPGWRDAQDALREIADSAAERGVPALLVLFPYLLPGEWTMNTYPLRAIYQKVADEARAAGFYVEDLTPVFLNRGGDCSRWWATPYDPHPGPDAHALAAEALIRRILSERWLAPNPAPAGPPDRLQLETVRGHTADPD